MRLTRAEFMALAPAAWLFVRLVLGIEWARGGWEKIGDPGWTDAPAGAAVQGFLNGAIAKSTEGPHPEVPHWWHQTIESLFLPQAEAVAYLVAYGELIVGLALIVGVFTRLAAVVGVAMNLAFLWSGTSSTNPQFVVLGLAIVLLGTAAGSYGADRWIGPWLRGRAGHRGWVLGSAALLGLALAVSAGFAWLIGGAWVWLVAASVAIGAAVAARFTPLTFGR